MRTAAALLATVIAVFGATASSTTATPQQPCVNLAKTLSVGSRGADVYGLQQVLGISPTSYFGPLTRQKLVQWQLVKKIIPSTTSAGAGTTGPKTRAALRCSTQSSTVPVATSTLKTGIFAPAPTTTESTAASTTSVPTQSMTPSGGGGGGGGTYTSPYGYTCTPIEDQPPTDSCTDGTWQVSGDEAGCAVWACISSDTRG